MTPLDLRVLRSYGYTVSELASCGYEFGELRKAGYSGLQLIKGGAPAKDMQRIGFSTKKIQPILKKLCEKEYPAKKLRLKGYDCLELYKSGYLLGDLRKAGYSVLDAYRTLKYQLLKSAKKPLLSKKIVGPLKLAGFTGKDITSLANQLRSDGSTVKDLLKQGFKLRTLHRVGFSGSEVSKAGFPLAKKCLLKRLCGLNCDCSDLYKSGYSLKDLREAGFQDMELFHALASESDSGSIKHWEISQLLKDDAGLTDEDIENLATQMINNAISGSAADALKDEIIYGFIHCD